MLKKLCLILYYIFARHLPGSDQPYSFGSKQLRRFLCKRIFDSAGKGVNIEHGAFFGSGTGIEVGDYSGLGLNCRVSGPLSIGSNVMMGPDVMIYTQNHNFSRTDIPMLRQGNSEKRKVTVGDDVWIAARAVILPGVVVGDGAVIGAGAVVARDVPPYAVVAGNPAKVIRYRKEQEQ